MKWFQRIAWLTLALTVGVILWGSVVRATGSGAGCANDWPACRGALVPQAPSGATLIEFAHRLTSGLSLAAVLLLAVWARGLWPAGHRVRRASALALVFVILEALVGAGLVLLSLVGDNATVMRAIFMAGHLINTYLLLASLALTAWWARRPEQEGAPARPSTALVVTLAVLLLLSIAGALTALGDTLFPAGNLREGLTQDFLPTAHFLIRLRVIHPLLALVASVFVFVAMVPQVSRPTTPWSRRLAAAAITLFFVQAAIGGLNLLMGTPLGLQVLHLALADGVWLAVVMCAAV